MHQENSKQNNIICSQELPEVQHSAIMTSIQLFNRESFTSDCNLAMVEV